MDDLFINQNIENYKAALAQEENLESGSNIGHVRLPMDFFQGMVFLESFDEMEKRGLIAKKDGQLFLTESGKFWIDSP